MEANDASFSYGLAALSAWAMISRSSVRPTMRQMGSVVDRLQRWIARYKVALTYADTEISADRQSATYADDRSTLRTCPPTGVAFGHCSSTRVRCRIVSRSAADA